MTKPQNCGTSFCSCIECVNDDGPEWYLKQVDETEPDWKQLAADAAHTMAKARIWGGMDWHYNPLHPIHYTPMLKRLNEALAPLTMPKGHTREQIGLQLDDSREELTAHHVYCRVVAEDV